jgi:hypothetical protein
MFCKQMDATWLFSTACSKSKVTHNVNVPLIENTCEIEGDHEIENEGNYEDQPCDHKLMMEKSFMPGNYLCSCPTCFIALQVELG